MEPIVATKGKLTQLRCAFLLYVSKQLADKYLLDMSCHIASTTLQYTPSKPPMAPPLFCMATRRASAFYGEVDGR
jgi:hypothetical protein